MSCVLQALQAGGGHHFHELACAMVRHPGDARRQSQRKRVQPGEAGQPSGEWLRITLRAHFSQGDTPHMFTPCRYKPNLLLQTPALNTNPHSHCTSLNMNHFDKCFVCFVCFVASQQQRFCLLHRRLSFPIPLGTSSRLTEVSCGFPQRLMANAKTSK